MSVGESRANYWHLASKLLATWWRLLDRQRILDIFGRDRFGWDQSQLRTGSCGSRKKQLTRDRYMLEIFGLRPTSVGEFWLGPVLVQDIWSGLTSVEYDDALTKVPVGL